MEESMHVGEQETSLQDQSYHTIRRKIVYLDYKPGEKLGVKQLCDDLDMGRTLCARRWCVWRRKAWCAPCPRAAPTSHPSTSPLPRVPVTSASIWKSR